jgi:hypothetical protein
MVDMSPAQREKYNELRREGYTHDTALNSVGINTWSFRSPLDNITTTVSMRRTKKKTTKKKTTRVSGKKYKILGMVLMIISLPLFANGASYVSSYFTNRGTIEQMNLDIYAGPELDQELLESAYDLQGYMNGTLIIWIISTLGIASIFLIVGYTQYKKGKEIDAGNVAKKKKKKARIQF